jgi:hypothetical protein
VIKIGRVVSLEATLPVSLILCPIGSVCPDECKKGSTLDEKVLK